jgi:DNA-directed RNA polymerase specialized sigma24 family protein
MERFTERSTRSVEAVDHTTVDAARAIHALSDTDLIRLKALARLWSRGLPNGLGWVDILNETIVRVLDGSRPWPRRVPLLAFLSGVMRSICDDQWRKARRELLVRNGDGRAPAPVEEAAMPDPERTLAAAQALAEVNRLFAADPSALKVIAGLEEGFTPGEIRRIYGMTELEYDTTRKRMRRTLLRQDLAWSRP